MPSIRWRLAAPLAVAGLTVLAARPALAAGAADGFPARPVTIVVPFPAGGATDVTARIVAEGLQKKWRQPVVVDNRAGAGGNIGSEYVARAAPDGYTLVLGVTGSHGINTSLYPRMRYHPLRDFQPLTLAAQYPNAIVVNPALPVANLPQLMALLRAAPGKYAYGSDGNGTASHLGMELLRYRAGVTITHVPYRGGAPMLTDLMGGQIMVGITGLPAVLPYVKAGKLRLLAITTAQRFAGAPEYPTVQEQGFAGFSAAPWSGFFAPARTPQALVDKISADMHEVMTEPQARKRMLDAGSAFAPDSPEDFRTFVEGEIATWSEAVRLSGARAE